MPYFNYHAKAMNLIKNNHCIFAIFEKEYHKISPALVLFFDNSQPMPIREHAWHKYYKILDEKNIKIIFNLDIS